MAYRPFINAIWTSRSTSNVTFLIISVKHFRGRLLSAVMQKSCPFYVFLQSSFALITCTTSSIQELWELLQGVRNVTHLQVDWGKMFSLNPSCREGKPNLSISYYLWNCIDCQRVDQNHLKIAWYNLAGLHSIPGLRECFSAIRCSCRRLNWRYEILNLLCYVCCQCVGSQ